jgi:hypothetical protein
MHGYTCHTAPSALVLCERFRLESQRLARRVRTLEAALELVAGMLAAGHVGWRRETTVTTDKMLFGADPRRTRCNTRPTRSRRPGTSSAGDRVRS